MPFDYTGSFSGSFTGDLTSTNGVVSSSAQLNSLLPSGVISSSTQVNYAQLQNKPITISAFQKNSIVANNNFRERTYPIESASFAERITELETNGDAQTLSFNSSTNALTISNGNSVDLSSLAGGGSGGSGLAITASDEGSVLSQNVRSINFVGNAVTATNSGNAITVTINTGSGGVSTDISALNAFTGSAQISLTALNAATSSYLTSVPSGTVSSSTQITNVVTDSYISASAAASGFGGGDGTTYTAGSGISISGNVISIDTSSTHFKLGVSGAAAYYGFGSGGGSFGDPPVIDQTGLQIREYTGSGAYVGTLTVTDPTPGDTATWEIQSGYTAGFFTISTAGVVTTNATTTASMNTSNASGSNLSHPFLVKVTDGQNNVVNGTIYIHIIPNEAPKFRLTSVNGSVITSFTSSAQPEQSGSGTVVATIYFTDAEGDAITIGSGSWSYGDSSHFTITKNSNNVVITQATSSLDYETYDHYQFYLTASDAKYPTTDSDSISYLPIRITVGDNLAPTIADQTLAGVNENSSDAQSAGTVSITDTEGDTSATIVSMTLRSAYMDGIGTNVTSSLGGTSLYNPHQDPFTFSGKTIIRKNGVYLNSDVANRYTYRIGVKDAFNDNINYGIVTIPIANDAASAITDNWTNVYVIESAVDGDYLYINSNGRSGTIAAWSSAASQRWSVSSDGDLVEAISVTGLTGSSVELRLKNNVSGSLYSYDGIDTINVRLTASENGFETTKQYIDLAVNLAINNAPVGTYSATSANLNTNGARPSNTLYTLTWTDAESNPLNHSSFTLTSNADITSSWNGGYVYTIKPSSNLSAGTYYISASVKDQHGFRTGVKSQTMTIAQAGTGTLTTNGTFYVIESAVSGNLIYTNSNGRSGTQGDLGVTYSTIYNSQAVQSFTSSNAMVHVTNAGALSIAQNVSSSAYTYDAGTPITSNITWQDQFGNIGGPTQISVTVAINNAPSVSSYSPTTNNRNTNLGVAGAQLATMTWSDTESDSLNVGSFSLSGAGSSLLSSSYNGGNQFKITALNDLSAGPIAYTASIKDVHGFRTGTYKDTITIAQAVGGTLSSTSFYIIESALSGAAVVSNTSGTGSAATLSVGYSPTYGGQAAEQFRTLDSILSITSTGTITVKQNISGSVYQNGNSFSPTVYWVDQYGNEGTGSITVNSVNNQNPTAVFSDATLTAPVSVNTTLVTATLTDPEGATPFSMSLSGPSAVSMSAVPQNANSSSYYIKNTITINDGVTLNYTASVFDAYNNETQYKKNLVIAAPASNPPLWYLYTSEPGQYAIDDEATYLATYGDANDDGTTDSGYPFDDLTAGEIGNTSFTSTAYTGFGDTNTLVASGSILSGSNATPLISNLNHTNLGFIIVFPSSSEIGINPSSMTNALGGSTTNQYVLFSDRPGTGVLNDNPQTSYVRYFDLDSGTYPNSSATRFGVIFVGGGSSNITYFLMASSGSTPSSTQ
jgi:VCBS repeat-containing protein